jgi:phosphoglycerate dehydrogenase-like enzyme
VTNIGRGPVIDEKALLEAIETGHLGGAVLDVFDNEPLPADSPFWEFPNVLVSPHSASTVANENARLADLFVENLRRFLDGEPLLNRYHADRGY